MLINHATLRAVPFCWKGELSDPQSLSLTIWIGGNGGMSRQCEQEMERGSLFVFLLFLSSWQCTSTFTMGITHLRIFV